MACGGCGARRDAAKTAADGKITKYVVTWGDGTTEEHATLPMARVAMSQQTDNAKRRRMRVGSIRR